MERTIPTENDWENWQNDLDQKWAHENFIGKTNEEMQEYFKADPLLGAEDLHFMPEIPFRYYVIGFRDYVMSMAHSSTNIEDASFTFHAAEASSSLLMLVRLKLIESPDHICPIMPELLPALEYVANHQHVFDADEEIYGRFFDKFSGILITYKNICHPR